MLLGPGNDAAIVRCSDTCALAIGMESHNHPSYVDPYDGAATGVGGIVRDILSMSARLIALMDPLYDQNRQRAHDFSRGILDLSKNQYLITMRRAYRYRPYPTKSQVTLLEQTLELCRWVYNDTLAYERTPGNRNSVRSPCMRPTRS